MHCIGLLDDENELSTSMSMSNDSMVFILNDNEQMRECFSGARS